MDPKRSETFRSFYLSFKILIHVDFNLLSFIQLSALVGNKSDWRIFYVTYRCLHKPLFDLTKRDRSVQWLCCGLNDREIGFRFSASVGDFSVLQNFQNGPGTCTASSSRVVGAPSEVVNRSSRKVDLSIASNSEVETVEVYLHSSYTSFTACTGTNLLKSV